MVVNTQCGTTGTRTTTVTLDASELDGSAYSYLVQDVYSKESVVTNSGASPSFSVELDPGEGKLFRIEPWDDSVTLTGDVTIPSGITLTLDPRATVEFVANSDDTNTENDNDNDGTRSELIVAGTLDASSPGITFRSSNDADDASRNDWCVELERRCGQRFVAVELRITPEPCPATRRWPPMSASSCGPR